MRKTLLCCLAGLFVLVPMLSAANETKPNSEEYQGWIEEMNGVPE